MESVLSVIADAMTAVAAAVDAGEDAVAAVEDDDDENCADGFDVVLVLV